MFYFSHIPLAWPMFKGQQINRFPDRMNEQINEWMKSLWLKGTLKDTERNYMKNISQPIKHICRSVFRQYFKDMFSDKGKWFLVNNAFHGVWVISHLSSSDNGLQPLCPLAGDSPEFLPCQSLCMLPHDAVLPGTRMCTLNRRCGKYEGKLWQ